MKKYIVIVVLATTLMGAAGFAEARGNNGGYYNGHYSSHGSNRHYRNNYRNHRGYSNRYNRHNYRGHSSRHHLRDGLKVAAGALLIGSIIHAASNNHRERVVVRRRSAPVRNSEYWYRIDNEGQCVEVRLNQQGQEVWTYVDPSYCD